MDEGNVPNDNDEDNDAEVDASTEEIFKQVKADVAMSG